MSGFKVLSLGFTSSPWGGAQKTPLNPEPYTLNPKPQPPNPEPSSLELRL